MNYSIECRQISIICLFNLFRKMKPSGNLTNAHLLTLCNGTVYTAQCANKNSRIYQLNRSYRSQRKRKDVWGTIARLNAN